MTTHYTAMTHYTVVDQADNPPQFGEFRFLIQDDGTTVAAAHSMADAQIIAAALNAGKEAK